MKKSNKIYRITPGQEDSLDIPTYDELSGGAKSSDLDIPTYQELSKKKGSGSVVSGAVSSVSPSPSQPLSRYKKDPVTGLEFLESPKVETSVKQPDKPSYWQEAADPVRHALQPFSEKVEQSSQKLKSFGEFKQAPTDITPQGYGLRPKRTIKDDDRSLAEIEHKDAVIKQDEMMNSLYNNYFKDGKDAKQWLINEVQNKGIDALENNKTAQLAAARAKDYDTKKQLLEGNNINEVAVDLMRDRSPHFDKLVSALEQGRGIEKGMDYYKNVIPNALQGRLVDELRNDKDVKAIAEENPQLADQLKELDNGGIYKLYPDYGKTIVRNMMSREYENDRANLIANPIFDKSSYLDNMADRLFKDNPGLHDIANSMKGNWSGELQTSGLVDEFASGAKSTLEQMGESVKDFFGGGMSHPERIYQGLKQEAETVDTGAPQWKKDLGHMSNFLGMMSAMAVPSGILKGAGITPKAISTIVTADTFYDNEKNTWAMKYPDEEWKADLGALLSTAMFTAGFKAFNSDKFASALTNSMEPSIKDAIAKLDAGATEAEVKHSLSTALQEGIKGIGESTGTMVGITALQSGLDNILGIDPEANKKYHPDTELAETAKSMMLGVAFPRMFEAIVNKNAVANSLSSISKFPDRYISQLEMMRAKHPELSSDIDAKIEDIRHLNSTKQALDALNIPEQKQGRYLLEDMNQRYERMNRPNVSDPSMVDKFNQRSERFQKTKDDILSGKEVKELPVGETKRDIELTEKLGQLIPGKEIGVVEPQEISKPIDLEPEITSDYKKTEVSKDTPISDKIVPTESFRTMDLGDWEGKKEDDNAKKEFDNVVKERDVKAGNTGETFDQFISRVIPQSEKILDSEKNNTTIVTHSSVLKAIKAWDEIGRPPVTEILKGGSKEKEFTDKYLAEETQNGDVVTIKGKNGDIHVVRHGQTADNLENNFRTRDTELTDKGVRQAQESGNELSKVSGSDIPKIITSDLPRTIHTSNIIENETSKSKEQDLPFGRGKTSGVSHASQQIRAYDVNADQPVRGEGVSVEEAVKHGQELLKEGGDPEKAAEDFKKNKTISYDQFSLVSAKHHQLEKETEDAFIAGGENENDKGYLAAKARERDWYNNVVKPMETEWHKIGMRMQALVDIDTGNYHSIVRSIEEKTQKPVPEEKKKIIRKMADKNKAKQKETDDAERMLIQETEKEKGGEKIKKESSSEKFKKYADNFRKTFKQKPITFKDENGNDIPIQKMGIGWNDLVELGAKAIEKTGKIIDGINAIIDYIKEEPWYQKLSDKDKNRFYDTINDYYKSNSAEGRNISKLEKELEDLQSGIAKQKSPKREQSEREKELREQIRIEKEKLGLIPSKEKKPLTEEEQKDKQEKEAKKISEKYVDKIDTKFTEEEAKDIWDYAKKNYLDKGVKYVDMIPQVSEDLGLSWKQVNEAIGSPKTKRIADSYWKKQYELRRGQIATKAYIEEQEKGVIEKMWTKASRVFRGSAVFGHGGVFIGTHAGMNMFEPKTWKYVFPAFIKAWKFAYGNKARYEQAMQELKHDRNYTIAQRAGLKNDPDIINVEEFQNFKKSSSKFNLAGERGFNAIKVLRQQMFNMYYDKLTDGEKENPKIVESIAKVVNLSTGATNTKLPRWVNEVSFAGGMEVARWQKLTQSPYNAGKVAIKSLFGKDVKPEDKVFAKVWSRRVGSQLGFYIGGLLTNAAIQNTLNPNNPVNITNPNKGDWLKFKFGQLTLDPTSGMRSTADFIYELFHTAFKNQKELRGDTRWETAGKQGIGYFRGKLAPFYSTLADLYTKQDYYGNPLPYSSDKPKAGKHKLGYWEYLTQKFPIPVAEAFHEIYQNASEESGDKSVVQIIMHGLMLGALSGSTGFRFGEYEPRPEPYTEEEKKSSIFKPFIDKGLELPSTSLSSTEITDYKSNTKKTVADLPKEEQEKYIELHKENFKKELKKYLDIGDFYVSPIKNKEGYYDINTNMTVPGSKKIKFEDMDKEQLSDILHTAYSEATAKTKKKLFGEKSLSPTEEVEKDIHEAKKEIYELKNN